MPEHISNDQVVDGFDENGRSLDPFDYQRAADVPEMDPLVAEGTDPILKAELFEGDIYNVSQRDIRDMRFVSTLGTRNAIRNMNLLWPNNKVPYRISSEYSTYERSVIASAFQEYHERTCIKSEHV